MSETAEKRDYTATSTCVPKMVYNRGQGSWIYDEAGRGYLDFGVGPGVANLGWNHPELTRSVAAFILAGHCGYGGNDIASRSWLELAEKLASITPGNHPKVVFPSNSGTEAVEAGIIACMSRRPERKSILTFGGDFHGRTGYARAATTSKPVHILNMPRSLNTHYLIFPADSRSPDQPDFLGNPDRYMDYVHAQIGRFVQDINVAVLEPVQGEGGVNFPNVACFNALVNYLRANGVYIMIDEVQTGFGRTGRMWACEMFDFVPDIITMAKAAGGGLVPAGYTVMGKNLDYDQTGRHSNTFGGNPLAAYVTLKVLEIMEKEDLVVRSRDAGSYLSSRIYDALTNRKLAAYWGYRFSIGGEGLMQRISFFDTFGQPSASFRDRVVDWALVHGLFLIASGPSSIRLMPPLRVSQNEIDTALVMLNWAIGKASESK